MFNSASSSFLYFQGRGQLCKGMNPIESTVSIMKLEGVQPVDEDDEDDNDVTNDANGVVRENGDPPRKIVRPGHDLVRFL